MCVYLYIHILYLIFIEMCVYILIMFTSISWDDYGVFLF